jgi:hypothetical protein
LCGEKGKKETKNPSLTSPRLTPPLKNQLAILSQKYYIARQPFTFKPQGACP